MLENWQTIRVRATTINILCLDPRRTRLFYGGIASAGIGDGIAIQLCYSSPTVGDGGNGTGAGELVVA